LRDLVHRPGSKFEQCEAQSAASIFKASLMARAATSLMKDQLLPKLQQLYNRSRQVQYQQVEDVENNNYSCVNNNLLELPEPSSPSLRRWQRWSRNLVGLNCLFVPTPRRSSLNLLTWNGAPAEVAVLQVALVTLGRHMGLLSTWYSQPEDSKIPQDSVLFPISRHLIKLLNNLAQDISEVGALCSMPAWWYGLEMRQLRLRQNINALYLYDTLTDEQMLLYRPGQVTLDSEYSRTFTIASRLQVSTL